MVAPQTPTPLHTPTPAHTHTSAHTHTFCTPWARKGVLGYVGWGCLKWTMPRNIVWIQGWCHQHPHLCTHPYVCTQWAGKGVFGYLGWGRLTFVHQRAPSSPDSLPWLGWITQVTRGGPQTRWRGKAGMPTPITQCPALHFQIKSHTLHTR